MKNQVSAVQLFHKTFGAPIGVEPQLISKERNDLRYELMREENQEYIDACNSNDMVEVADALGDMLYILCGTIVEHGMQHKIEQVFNEIQASNMSKLDEAGNPIYREDGKILKGKNYFKPNIKKILEEFNFPKEDK